MSQESEVYSIDGLSPLHSPVKFALNTNEYSFEDPDEVPVRRLTRSSAKIRHLLDTEMSYSYQWLISRYQHFRGIAPLECIVFYIKETKQTIKEDETKEFMKHLARFFRDLSAYCEKFENIDHLEGVLCELNQIIARNIEQEAQEKKKKLIRSRKVARKVTPAKVARK